MLAGAPFYVSSTREVILLILYEVAALTRGRAICRECLCNDDKMDSVALRRHHVFTLTDTKPGISRLITYRSLQIANQHHSYIIVNSV